MNAKMGLTMIVTSLSSLLKKTLPPIKASRQMPGMFVLSSLLASSYFKVLL